jgi:hypothetical protein
MSQTAKSWSATDVDSVIIPRDYERARLTIQLYSENVVYLAFGEHAKVGEGIKLCDDYRVHIYTGPIVTEAVHAICEDGKIASGGYQVG